MKKTICKVFIFLLTALLLYVPLKERHEQKEDLIKDPITLQWIA